MSETQGTVQELTLTAGEVGWILGEAGIEPAAHSMLAGVVGGDGPAGGGEDLSSPLVSAVAAVATTEERLVTRSVFAGRVASGNYYALPGGTAGLRLVSCLPVEGGGFHFSFPWDVETLGKRFSAILTPSRAGGAPGWSADLSATAVRLLAAVVDASREWICASLLEKKQLTSLKFATSDLGPFLELGSEADDTRSLSAVLGLAGARLGPRSASVAEAGWDELAAAGLVEVDEAGGSVGAVLLEMAVDLLVPLPALVLVRETLASGARHEQVLLRGRGLWSLARTDSGNYRLAGVDGPGALLAFLELVGGMEQPGARMAVGPPPLPSR